jgi:hypothetical protein
VEVVCDDADAGVGWVPDDDAPPIPGCGGAADTAMPAVVLVWTGLVGDGDWGASEPAPGSGRCAGGGGADVEIIVVVVVVVVGSAAAGDTLGWAPDPKAQPSILPGGG